MRQHNCYDYWSIYLSFLEWLEARTNDLVLQRVLASGRFRMMCMYLKIHKVRTQAQYLIHNQSLLFIHEQKCYSLELTDDLAISHWSKAFETPNLLDPECSEKWGTHRVHITNLANVEHTFQSKVRSGGVGPGSLLCSGLIFRQWVCHNSLLLPVGPFPSSLPFFNIKVWGSNNMTLFMLCEYKNMI